MKKTRVIFLLILLPVLTTLYGFGQEKAIENGLNAISESAVRGQLGFLASDWTEGRATGEKGGFMAADYIASLFQVYGVEPAGDYTYTQPSREERWAGVRPQKYRTHFQDFPLIKYTPGNQHKFSVISETDGHNQIINFDFKTDFTVRYSDISRIVESEIVFVGYGYVNEENKYDDYKGVDVNGKIILILNGYPGHNDTASEAYQLFTPQGRWASYYLERDKIDVAVEKGVAGIISMDPDNDRMEDWVTNYPFRYQSPYYEGYEKLPTIQDYSLRLPKDTLNDEPVRIHVTLRTANEIVRGTGLNIKAFEEMAAEKMKPGSQDLNKFANIKVKVDSEIIKARNVVGVIEGKDSENIIVVGAHYDHYGTFNGYIWNGADDNGSGTVGIMTLAKAVMATGEKPEKTIVFAAWDGEEKGLLGSRYFVENPYKPLENIMLNINLDMISRDSEDDTLGIEVRMSYYEPYAILEEISKTNLEKYEIGLDVDYRPSMSSRGGSDHAPFAMKKIPYIFWMAGFHTDYHTPTDEISKVNYTKLTNIIRLTFLDLWEYSNTDKLMED